MAYLRQCSRQLSRIARPEARRVVVIDRSFLRNVKSPLSCRTTLPATSPGSFLPPPAYSFSADPSSAKSSCNCDRHRRSYFSLPNIAAASLVGSGLLYLFSLPSDLFPLASNTPVLPDLNDRGVTPSDSLSLPPSDELSTTATSPYRPPPSYSTSVLGGPVTTKGGQLVTKLKIFVGYDPKEDLAYEICRHSILRHATIPVEIIPIKQAQLRQANLYSRTRCATESTEFSFTRFLTPYLAGFQGWAMFVDCDFLYTADVRELVELIDERYAIMCVPHNHIPTSGTKKDGALQTAYVRKNWSSMVLYNCSHAKNRALTPDVVNSQSASFLHRFLWLNNEDIGYIPVTWNFLVGHNKVPRGVPHPKAIHYTSGGPWLDAWKDCEFADLWFQEVELFRHVQYIKRVMWSDDVAKSVEANVNERTEYLEERITEVEGKLKEVDSVQRMLLASLPETIMPESNVQLAVA